MTVVQQSRERFPLRGMPFHRRLEQRLLDIARHITLDVHGRLTQQISKAFVGHVGPPSHAPG